jgi:hypothetical protein
MEFVNIYEQNAELPPEEWTRSAFTLEIPMNLLDRIRPKQCTRCKKWFLKGGKKQISGDMRRTALTFEYVCETC